MPRTEWLRLLPDHVVHGFDIHAREVDFAGDVAAVLTSATQLATVHVADRSGEFVLSDIWLRGTDGLWRVWRRHSPPATAGAIPRSD